MKHCFLAVISIRLFPMLTFPSFISFEFILISRMVIFSLIVREAFHLIYNVAVRKHSLRFLDEYPSNRRTKRAEEKRNGSRATLCLPPRESQWRIARDSRTSRADSRETRDATQKMCVNVPSLHNRQYMHNYM